MIVHERLNRLRNEVRHQLGFRPCVGALAIMLGVAVVPVVASAAECPAPREPSIPPPDSIATPDTPIAKGFNIDTYKRQLTKYHDGGNYNADIAAVIADATRYVEGRAEQVRWPAVVLDIDETSLSNWDNLKADDFGFIEDGPCSLQAKMACGFDEWINKAIAPPIEPTLKFFQFVRDRNIAVFFITGRRDKQRRATLWNLDRHRDPTRRSAGHDRTFQKRGTRQGRGKVHHPCQCRRPGQRSARFERQIRRVLV